MYQVWIAYVLWIVGGFGCLGLHRFYMRKIPTGVLWILTGGLAFFGSVYDFLTMTRQIEAANRNAGFLTGPVPAEITVRREKEPLERVILKTAEKNAGRVSAVVVAANSDWTVDQVQNHLDGMVKRRMCELRVLKSGAMVYHFAEFDPASDQDFEV
jgi:TM2 domain-containing membrane protein YozV